MSKQEEDPQSIGALTEKRKRVMTQEALQYTVENKQKTAKSLERKLKRIIESLEALEPKSCSNNMLRELMAATEEFDLIRQELASLYKQDKRGVYESQAFLMGENTTLQLADQLISKIKSAQKPDKLSDTMSVRSRDSRRSRASRASTSSSVIRMRALVEAATAKEQAEYDRLMAEKENEMKQREAEEEKRRQQARAQHERDVAIMSADKRVAVANAKLKAIQESFIEKELNDPIGLPDMEITECQERTMTWVNSSYPLYNICDSNPKGATALNDERTTKGEEHTPANLYVAGEEHLLDDENIPIEGHTPVNICTPGREHSLVKENTPKEGHTPANVYSHEEENALAETHIPEVRYTPTEGERRNLATAPTTKVTQNMASPTNPQREFVKVIGKPPPSTHYTFNYPHPSGFSVKQPALHSTPKETSSGIPLETFAASNQRLVASLAKQSLPKCHPDLFDGDVTMFHSWKRSFKAMVRDADVTADQEINYLRNYTNGEPQQLVDNYRKRQGDNPASTLAELWTELERRFGNTAALTQALLERLSSAASFGEKDNTRLQKLADLCVDVDCQMTHLPGLACLNYPIAIRPVIEKLPASLKTKWEKEIVRYAEKHNDAYPTFCKFSKMIQNQAKLRNHPNVSAGGNSQSSQTQNRRREEKKGRFPQSGDETKRPLKTSMDEADGNTPRKENPPPPKAKHCLFHKRAGHELTECMTFKKMTVKEREQWVREERVCFRCFSPNHVASVCTENVKCSICGSRRHPNLLHLTNEEKKERAKETEASKESQENVIPKCTSVCKGTPGGLSCSKTVLVDVYREDHPNDVHRVYAIVDDQSNASIISTELADKLNAEGPDWKYYLSTCGGDREVRYGRRISGLIIRSIHGRTSKLPTLIECDGIPQEKKEIPTPEIAREHPHLRSIAEEIPPLDKEAKIQLLIGRDAPELLKVRAFKNGPKGAPWAQKLALGWTISGQTCLDLTDRPIHIQAKRTRIARDEIVDTTSTDGLTPYNLSAHAAYTAANTGAEYEIVRCPNTLNFREGFTEARDTRSPGEGVYHETENDDVAGLSIDDRKFIEIMDKGIHKNERGNWEMPLPFRSHNVSMPDNRGYAAKRLNGLLRTFKRKPKMEKDYLEFMGKMLDKGHAVPVPDEEISSKQGSGQLWYLPHFGVYHPKKPDQIRVVFDSSAECQGKSLNQELLTGPDLMNSLTGVLIRFRREDVAAMCDVEQMFHSFHVTPEHRDFLRFLWFKNNDLSMPITEFRMTVHLFGNGPSPAVATYGLRRTVDDGEEHDPEVKEFVQRNFYVDDGLVSKATAEEVVTLIKNTQAALGSANLRLHKVVSNSVSVMKAFPTEDLAKDIRSLDLTQDNLPAQRSLGVFWNLETDAFTYKVSVPDKPFTRRGVLSVVNSIYDPLGLAAPVLLDGRLLLQRLVAMGKKKTSTVSLGWDDPLPEELASGWQRWKTALPDLQNVSIPRCLHPVHFSPTTKAEIHAFSDASQRAIGVAVYLRLFNPKGEVCVSLMFGQAKVAPINPISVPRLELCGAVLAVQAVDRITKEIDIAIADTVFYTDSRVVLGYICNESRRFHIYVANRVQTIRKISSPDQWRYVESSNNPADLATRGLHPKDLAESSWLRGPEFLRNTSETSIPGEEKALLSADDPEVRKEPKLVMTRTMLTESPTMGAERFKRYSSWSSLRRAIAVLIAKVKSQKERNTCGGRSLHVRYLYLSPEVMAQATEVIIKSVQRETFKEELDIIAQSSSRNDGDRNRAKAKKKSLKKSSVYRLDPYIDDTGILRVGGRLHQTDLTFKEKHPVLLPKGHHVSMLILRYYHEQVHHQGRQITHGALRNAGYWLVGGHGAVASLISSCVTCRRLRGPMLEQKMADLPPDRAEIGPPFTNVGFDVFGPWTVQTRRTRGGAAGSKRWGLVFTCLASRAIHIELLETMDASSFICALRRFFSIRGPVTRLRCDRGSNFVGGKSELDEALAEMDKKSVERYLSEQDCEWQFNPPHASHFGGVWERQIGTIRRILDAMLIESGVQKLTHELLVTLMSEVAAIVNSRPITAIPSDTDEPLPLTPSTLLTQKTRPLGPLPGKFVSQDLYARRRWRKVQYLAEQFWIRWRREYIQNLQVKTKWNREHRNLAVDDIVLMKDEQAHRNNWPLGRVVHAIKSEDGRVRRATVLICRDGQKRTYERPIGALVLLVPSDEHSVR